MISLKQKKCLKQQWGGGIKISYFNFIHPVYKQLGKNFIPYLSVLDFLMNSQNPSKEFALL
ncbi:MULTISPECIES: WbqC family protein [unclassified Campylobacter]|uniref:WbqC family protein n=1 Tax=unclassified Campylobacter TaxID=2593542 RepID=UPI001389ACC7|nr:WbqC family protein [Campylobacter sp. MIT 19-121]